MTNKSNFTPAEWKVLLQSMIAAGTAVTAADPSGLWGLLKESFAGATRKLRGFIRGVDLTCDKRATDRRRMWVPEITTVSPSIAHALPTMAVGGGAFQCL
jgi:hypothetical protein